jgi:integrating conjugative element protein (TIGR03761 family)
MNAARRSVDQPFASHPEESTMATPDMSSSPPSLSSPAPTALGQLADETPDVMTLHTQDAYRMFTGRAGDATATAPAIPGGRRFAAVLKSIWYLSANDNPYADWILIRVYQSLVAIRAQMAQAIEVREAEFAALRRKGLSLSVLGSRSPATVALGFRSPYGYATAEAIVEFDYHVRMVKTLVLKDRLSDADGRAAIRAIGRGLRALFLEPIRWERNLLRDEMLPLSRRDYLPGADDAARQRVRAAVALFGEVPRAVFTAAEAPRHSQRRVTPTAAELRLLQQVSLNIDAQPEPVALVEGQLL